MLTSTTALLKAASIQCQQVLEHYQWEQPLQLQACQPLPEAAVRSKARRVRGGHGIPVLSHQKDKALEREKKWPGKSHVVLVHNGERCRRDRYLKLDTRTGVDLILNQDTPSPKCLQFDYVVLASTNTACRVPCY